MRMIAFSLAIAIAIQPSGISAQTEATNAVESNEFVCPNVDTSRLSDADRLIWDEAYSQACKTMSADTFKIRVDNTNFRAGCRLGESRVPGKDLFALLSDRIYDFTVLTVPKLRGNASTNISDRTITIDHDRFELWNSTKSKKKARFINTIIHEMTHLVPRQSGGNSFYFRDRGNNFLTCPKRSLVSYGIGKIAQRTWLEMQ